MYRSYVQYGFLRNQYGVNLSRDNVVLKPVQFEWEPLDPAAETKPAFYLDGDAARALYDALGQALGLHLSGTRLASEVLALEQSRVNKLIDFLINPVNGL